ncbi:MAG: HutD family protein [Steroidobacteraceae bacterium]
MGIEVLRAAARAAVPWKNGGGVTREVAVHPPGSGFDTCEWRVSIAQVRSAGPFSSLPGLDRRLAVLEGTLSVVIDAAPEVRLAPAAAALQFPGEAPVRARPVEGPVTDLNIMTRRGHYSSALALHSAQSPTHLASGPASVLVLALTELVLKADQSEWQLSYLDGARLEGDAALEVKPARGPARFYVIRLDPQGKEVTRA